MKRYLVIAGGMLVLLIPVVLWAGAGITGVLTLFAGFAVITAVKALAKNEHAAMSVAAVAIVVTICYTVITLVQINAAAPVRISQEDHDKAKAVAMAAGKALAAIDLQNANGAKAAAQRDLEVARRDVKTVLAHNATLQKSLDTATARVATAEKQWTYWYNQTMSRPTPGYEYQGSGSGPQAAAASSRSPQWRQYHEKELFIASSFVAGWVRADCSQPAQSRAIEWSKTGANWQPLRDAEYTRRAVEHGAMACAG